MVLLSLASSFHSAQADDWPQWLGPRRDGVWRETGIREKFPDGGPPIRWRREIGGGCAGPAVAGGRVYVMDRRLASKPAGTNATSRGQIPVTERVVCLNEKNGAVLWQYAFDCTCTIS